MINKSIRRSWDLARHIGIAGVFSVPTSFSARKEFKSASRDSSLSYDELYLLGMRRSQYNILLSDKSFLQYSQSGEYEFRYAYYPNPFLAASQLADYDMRELEDCLEAGVINMEEYLDEVSNIDVSQHPPLLRYEYSVKQYQELKHPCSHFHIGHHVHSRWPVGRKLTPVAFSAIVFKLFYDSAWGGASFISARPSQLSLEEYYSNLRKECSILPHEHFSTDERSQFFWS